MLQYLKKISKSSYFLITLFSAGLILIILYLFPPLWQADASGNQVVKITFADDITPAYSKVIAMFNEQHRGKIYVETINIPFSKFSTNQRKELFTRFFRTTNSQVDVFSVDEIWTARFAKWCDPLGNHFPQDSDSKLLESALGSCYFDSTLVAVPLFIDVGLMYYRKDLIDRLPQAGEIENKLRNSITWDDFIRLGECFKKKQNPFYIFQADNYEGLMCSLTEMMAGLNDPLYSKGVFQLQTPGARKAVDLMVDLVQRYGMSPEVVTQMEENSSFTYCLNHNGVFLRGWPNFERSLQDSTANGSWGKRWSMAPLPHFAGLPRVSILGGWNLMISKYSLHKEEALTFVKFLLSKNVQEIMYEEGGYLPTNTSVYEDHEFMSKHPDLSFYLELLKTGVHRPTLPDYTRISDIISYYINLAIKQKMTPQAALSVAAQTIKNETDY
jgi:multiple sugar transport system substrate-binding protein